MRKDWHHLYKTADWQRLRKAKLSANPCCEYCEQQGRIELATVVDHIIPHKGDIALFLDYDNTQSLCKAHHDATKQKEERNGVTIGGDTSGFPIDKNHHWCD